jgi:DNA-directed RNA polymerase specialized sigma24 family protein
MPVERDTSIGGPGAAFPLTRPSIIAAATSDDGTRRRDAQETLVASYWKPIYKYIRIKWRKGNEDAKDLTQAFLSEFLDAALGRFDASRGSLRTFVRVSVDGFVSHDVGASGRLKRGGGVIVLPMEDEAGDLVDVAADSGVSMEDYFHREWQRQILALGVDDLRAGARAAGKDEPLAVFEAHDLVDEPPSYAVLAATFQLTSATVTNHLAWARRELRRLVLARIDAATASASEAAAEARALFARA